MTEYGTQTLKVHNYIFTIVVNISKCELFIKKQLGSYWIIYIYYYLCTYSPTTQYKARICNTPPKHSMAPSIHRYSKTVHRSTTQSRGREILISREGDTYFARGRYLFRGREIIISREGDTYFAGGRYLFRGREIIISREGDNYFAEGDTYFAGWRFLFRGREILILREGDTLRSVVPLQGNTQVCKYMLLHVLFCITPGITPRFSYISSSPKSHTYNKKLFPKNW